MTRAVLAVLTGLALAACTRTEAVTIHVASADPPPTCEAFCGSQDYSCDDSCWFAFVGSTGAGTGSYTSGSDFYEVDLIATCDTPIATTNASGYQLFEWSCCCDIPAQTRIDDPDLENPSTCDDVCEAAGMACNEQTYWPSPFIDGEFMPDQSGTLWVFERPDVRALNQGTCSELPGEYLPGDVLTIHRCGCE